MNNNNNQDKTITQKLTSCPLDAEQRSKFRETTNNAKHAVEKNLLEAEQALERGAVKTENAIENKLLAKNTVQDEKKQKQREAELETKQKMEQLRLSAQQNTEDEQVRDKNLRDEVTPSKGDQGYTAEELQEMADKKLVQPVKEKVIDPATKIVDENVAKPLKEKVVDPAAKVIQENVAEPIERELKAPEVVNNDGKGKTITQKLTSCPFSVEQRHKMRQMENEVTHKIEDAALAVKQAVVPQSEQEKNLEKIKVKVHQTQEDLLEDQKFDEDLKKDPGNGMTLQEVGETLKTNVVEPINENVIQPVAKFVEQNVIEPSAKFIDENIIGKKETEQTSGGDLETC